MFLDTAEGQVEFELNYSSIGGREEGVNRHGYTFCIYWMLLTLQVKVCIRLLKCGSYALLLSLMLSNPELVFFSFSLDMREVGCVVA